MVVEADGSLNGGYRGAELEATNFQNAVLMVLDTESVFLIRVLEGYSGQ